MQVSLVSGCNRLFSDYPHLAFERDITWVGKTKVTFQKAECILLSKLKLPLKITTIVLRYLESEIEEAGTQNVFLSYLLTLFCPRETLNHLTHGVSSLGLINLRRDDFPEGIH